MKITISLLALALLSACETTTTTTTTTTAAKRQTLAERMALVANNDEPAPPAEGPDDVPPGPAQHPSPNPGFVPSPLLRYSAASMTP
jgi:hypothetical protein